MTITLAARGAASAALLAVLSGCTREPPPDLGPGYPAPVGTLERMNREKDERGLRGHGWSLFRGLTRRTAEGTLVWESWPATGEMLGNPSRPARRLNLRAYAERDRSRPAGPSTLMVQPCDDVANKYPTLISVRFSPSAVEHVVDRGYQHTDVLTSMEGRRASITEFPRGAAAIKAVWWPVHPTNLTPMPVWTGPRAPGKAPQPCFGNSYLRWPRIIAIDPSPDAPVAKDPILHRVWWTNKADPFEEPLAEVEPAAIVPIHEFYPRRLTAEDLQSSAEWDQTFRIVLGRPAQLDDLVVLVGFHYTTKETPDWFWGTVWWSDVQADADQPKDLAADPVWKHFRLAATVDVWRRDPFYVKPNYAFNPWLEGSFDNGTASNCIDCHQRAVWKLGMTHDMRVPPYLVRFDHDDPAFDGTVRLDYIWTLARPREAPPPPPPAPPVPPLPTPGP